MIKKLKKNRKFAYFFTLSMFALVGVASWAFYALLNGLMAKTLEHFGIIDELIQNALIVVIVIIILICLGSGFFKVLEKIIK